MAENQLKVLKFHFDKLINDVKRGRLIPIVGGDINLCGRPSENGLYTSWQEHPQKQDGVNYPPTTSELALYLLKQAQAEESPIPTSILELIENNQDKNPDSILPIGLVNVCQYLHVWSSEWLAGTLNDLLSRNFEPTPVHHFLADLATVRPSERDVDAYPYPIIVTACFDNVLEKLLESRKQPFHLFSYVLDKEGGKFEYTPPNQGKPRVISGELDSATQQALKEFPVILKLNGGFKTGEESIFVTEDHYIDYLTHNNIENTFPVILSTMLKKKTAHLLFLGYPLRNWNLRVILRRIWWETLNADPENKHWSYIQEDRKDLDDQDFWRKYAIDKLKIQSDSIRLLNLQAYIDTLSNRLSDLISEQANVTPSSPPSPLPQNPAIPTNEKPLTPDSNVPQRELIFISYSHKDKRWLNMFKTHMAPIKDKLNTWDDQANLKAGDVWRDEIEKALKASKAAIFLVSPDFLASDFINKKELPALLKAAKTEGCKIFWIMLRDCLVNTTALKDFQALHEKPPLAKLTTPARDETFNLIFNELIKQLDISI